MDHPPARRPRDRKATLAAVAAELFRARGYHGVGINDIAAAGGVTGPALYRHFADKQAILAYVVLSGIDDMESATAETLTDGSPEQISTLLTTLAGQAVERREVAALWRWEGKHLPREDQREIRRRSAAVLSAWTKALLIHRPELTPDDAELLCWAGLSVFGSVSVHHTTIAKKRFSQLLVDLAHRVLHAMIPAQSVKSTVIEPLTVGTPARREQLLAAATALFGERGFHAVSMEDIGAAAGITGPSVYRHFPSKASLMVAIGHRAADRLAVGADQAMRCADESEALRRLAASYVDTLRNTPELSVSFSGDPVMLPERDKADLRRVQKDYVARWTALLSTIRPELNERESKIIVHAALTIANDLTRTRRVNTRPNLEAELVALMTAVLGLA
ncbi:DNA-binding transcriptional regulator, AcrR family [Amycolatopsis xylanica]|uniref:DNA-binding transcriptional regulator, AcrR family n=1 Tax=Amycolatopsis xylanica TaxID=589385 RepID=A0A1H3E0N0_9PSEU|nr:TetR/AcrR family transcriptional regulator [Amycolatopsis xylanica]SDX72231.1 DNA-binding transcriptional regulator, AcrR family [Amycolatopsis xylanica]